MWTDFKAVADARGLPIFGIDAGWTLMHRFHARYRLAQACKGLKFEPTEYTSGVAAGYDALTRCLLAWSAFEMCAKLVDESRNDLLRRHGADAMVTHLSWQTLAEPFYRVVLENLTHRDHKAEFAKFLQRSQCNPCIVLGAIRHVFAHGHLTPSAGGGDQLAAASACSDLAGYLMNTVIDADWTERVEDVLARL